MDLGSAENRGEAIMDASHDRAAYFNTDSRTFWLGQVSEAATALAGTRVPKQLIESVGVSKISTEPSAAVTSISLSVRNDHSFNPADHLELTFEAVRSWRDSPDS